MAQQTQSVANVTPSTPKSATESTRGRPVIAPPVDIYENADEYLVLADLPGTRTEDVQIRFEDGELTIHAARPDLGAGEVIGNEMPSADFFRRFQIPESVDVQKIDAKLQAGVLHLTLPKVSHVRPRKIAVKAA